MIAIIDYGSGNIGAIANVYKRLNVPCFIASDPGAIASADRLILPGVGAFDATMDHLKRSGMLEALNVEVIQKGKKVLGVCVGMQILADSSEEGILPGLSWVPGRVRKIDERQLSVPPKLPHMGWNSITVTKAGSPLFDGVDRAAGFYFLHSYYFDATSPADVVATVQYGNDIPCAVSRGNVFGVQFHPEKSHANGVSVFRNFAGLQSC
jgi:glutamine amidotransferase